MSQIGLKIGVPVFGDPQAEDATKIVREGIKHFHNTDVVIIDTSGRHALEGDLIKEIKDVAEISEAERAHPGP